MHRDFAAGRIKKMKNTLRCFGFRLEVFVPPPLGTKTSKLTGQIKRSIAGKNTSLYIDPKIAKVQHYF